VTDQQPARTETDDELIEQLARLLWDIATADGDFQAFPFNEMAATYPGMMATYRKQARECLRQMQWAYLRGSEPGVLAAGFDDYDFDSLPVVAPPEWTP
jgi:hypothetical protein